MTDSSQQPATDSKIPLTEAAVLALSLVVTVAYAPFTIATKLFPLMAQLPLAFLVAAVFFSMAIGSVFSAIRTKTGLLIAPAVGMAVVVSQINKDTITLWQLLIVTVLAGIAATWYSIPSRGQKSRAQVLVDTLPKPVKVGVRGGIGALLVTSAIDGLKEAIMQNGQFARWAVYGFVIATAVLLFAEVFFLRRKNASGAAAISLWSSLVDITVPVTFFVILFLIGAFPAPEWSWAPQLPASISSLPIFNVKGTDATLMNQGFSMGAFFIIILFIFLTDIPGSPYDILQNLAKKKPKYEESIKQSFFVTAVMAMFNPAVGLFTSVYYAENHVAVRDQDTDEGSKIGENPTVAVIAAICFAALGTVILFIKISIDDMRYWLLVAVSPSLFCLGVRITARALFRDFQDEMDAANDHGHSPPTLSFFIPVSLTIILTHIIDFELALPIGIIYFGISSNIPYREWRNKLGDHFPTIWRASLFVAAVVGVVHLEAYLKERTEHPVVECGKLGKLLEQSDVASAKALCAPHKP